MNQLDLTIGGRTFAIAVQPGDEEHVRRLGAEIESKFQQLANRYSQNLLFATLRLADELHNARAAKDKIEADSSEAINGMTALKQEADLAVGRAEKFRERVAELERELDQLQSAHQAEGNKYNELAEDNERFKIAVMEADAENTRLSGELATAKRELSASHAKLAQAQALLEADQGRSQQSSFIDPSMTAADPELAPSLERFAQLLEECAAKLEGPASDTTGLEGAASAS